MENEVKKLHGSKKSKQLDTRQKPPVLDRLGPRKPNDSQYDYTPLKIFRSDILQKVESLGILDKPAKILSPPKKRNKSKIFQFHKDYGYDTEQCSKLKKAIEQVIRNGKLKKFIDDASTKRSLLIDNIKQPWHDNKKEHKPDSSSSKLKVIDVIQDVGLPAS